MEMASDLERKDPELLFRAFYVDKTKLREDSTSVYMACTGHYLKEFHCILQQMRLLRGTWP